MRCLYQIYAQTPVVLENEPRCLDPRKPNAPCTAVTHAHASILGLNKIPWAGGSGYARQGEEVKDLGIAAGEDILESSHSESNLRLSYVGERYLGADPISSGSPASVAGLGELLGILVILDSSHSFNVTSSS